MPRNHDCIDPNHRPRASFAPARRKLACAAVLLLSAACGGTESVETELCEHLAEGPSKALTATTTASTAPDASAEHTRHDVGLVPDQGMNGGVITYSAAAEGDYVIGLGADVPLAIQGPDGAAIAIEATEKSGLSCEALKVKHTVELPVGRSVLRFGPTALTEVRLVIESGGEHAHD
jgi:hypothetical protein